MRILYVSHLYDPEIGAQTARVRSLSREWVRMGHEVTVLTAFPNHPAGRLYPGWKKRFWKFVDVTDDDGVRVVRSAHVPRPNRGAINRLIAFSSFTASAALTSFGMRGFDVVIGTVPQPLQPLASWARSAIGPAKFVLEIRDLWPEGLVATGQATTDSLAYKGLHRVASFLYRRADHVVSVTNAIRDHVVGDWRVPGNRVDVVRAGVDAAAFQVAGDQTEHKARWGFRSGTTVSYVGTLGNAHGLETVLAAAASLRDRRPDIEFVIAGDGAESAELRSAATSQGLSNVRFTGAVARDDVPSLLAASDVCLAVLRDDPLFVTVVPTKLYEYMAAGRPVIGNVPGEATDLIEMARAGLSVKPGDSEAIADAAVQMADNVPGRTSMGNAGVRWVAENATWTNRAEHYSAILERTINQK